MAFAENPALSGFFFNNIPVGVTNDDAHFS
jgi:hypothetical protein